jgi:hypothetical protein
MAGESNGRREMQLDEMVRQKMALLYCPTLMRGKSCDYLLGVDEPSSGGGNARACSSPTLVEHLRANLEIEKPQGVLSTFDSTTRQVAPSLQAETEKPQSVPDPFDAISRQVAPSAPQVEMEEPQSVPDPFDAISPPVAPSPPQAEPPAFARRMLCCLAEGVQLEALLGDLEEIFHDAIRNGGSLKQVKWLYLDGVLRSAPPLAWRKITKLIIGAFSKSQGPV